MFIMRHILLLFALLICIPKVVGAQPVMDSAMELFEELNRGKLPPSNQCSPDLDQIPYQELAQRCAVSLCGKPEKMKKYYVTDENFDRYVSEEVMEKFSKIEPKIKSILNKDIDQAKNLIRRLKKTIDKPDFSVDDLNGKVISSDFVAQQIYGNHVKFVIDSSKEVGKRIQLSFQKNINEEFMSGLKHFAEGQKKFIQTNFYKSIESGYLTDDESREKLRNAWATITEYSKKSEEFNKILEKKISFQLKDFISRLESRDREGLVTDAASINHLLLDIMYIEGKFEEEPRSYCNVGCAKGIMSWLKNNMKGMIRNLESEINDLKKQTVSLCKSAFAAGSISDYDSAKMLGLIPEIKKRFLDKILSLYSVKSRQKFAQYLKNDLEIVSIPTRLKKETSDVFNLIADIERKYRESLEGGGIDVRSDDASTAVRKLLSNYLRGKKLSLPERTICKYTQFQKILISDAFVAKSDKNKLEESQKRLLQSMMGIKSFTKDSITLSEHSCNHPEIGKAYISHELGHALSSVFMNGKLSGQSYKDYLNVRRCVTSQYKVDMGVSTRPLRHQEDTLVSEEDMADIVAWTAAYPDSNVSFCSLLTVNKNFSAYINLDIVADNQSHSTDFLRVLRETVFKGNPLSPSCQKIVDDNKDKYDFYKKCSMGKSL